jgi:hypothetical protein
MLNKNLFVKIFLSAFCISVLTSLSYAELFTIKYPDVGTDILKTSEKSSGKYLWGSTLKTQIIKHEGQSYLYIEENGEGIYNNNYRIWSTRSYFYLEGTRLIPYQVKSVLKNKEEKIVKTVEKFYDRENEEIICTINGKTKRFDLLEDIVDKENLGVSLNNYPFEEKRDFVFHLLTHEPTLYKITLKYRGEETITVGDKEYECHKIEMIPDLGLLNILGAFVPKTYFWYETKAPHEFVRYEGLESGLGTPYVVMDEIR